MLLSSFLFSIMAVFVKILSENLSSVEIVFFRNIFGVFFIFISFLYIPNSSIGGRFFILVFRGVIGCIALLMFFYNIAHISIEKAIIFSKLSPIFTALLAFFIFKEVVNKNIVLSILIGFIGVVFVVGFDGFDKNDTLGILSGILSAVAYSAVKELRTYYDSRVIVLSFVVIGSIIPLFFMFLASFITDELLLINFDFFMDKYISPTSLEWFYIVCMGIFATLAQFFMTQAYGYSKAAIVSTISYSTIIFSLIISFFLGYQLIGIDVLFGLFLIIVSSILVSKS
jgi:drug/metabolite transporter (DMT)-like permease